MNKSIMQFSGSPLSHGETLNTEHAAASYSVCTAGLVSAGLLRILFAGRKGDTVLFLGPAGAGKTTMYLQLRDGTVHNGTVASMAENVSRCMLIHEKVRLLLAALSGPHLAAIAVQQHVAACAQPAWAMCNAQLCPPPCMLPELSGGDVSCIRRLHSKHKP